MSTFNTSAITIDPITEHTYFLRDNVIRNLIIIVGVIIVLFLLSKVNFIKKIIDSINNNKKIFKIIKWTGLFFILLSCSIFVLKGKFQTGADQYSVQEVAGSILKGDFSALGKGEYLSRYPILTGLVLISSIFTMIFGVNNYIALGLVNSLLIVLFYKNLSEIFGEFKKSNFIQLCIIYSAFFFPVLLVYSYFVYGTVPGAALCIISLKYLIKYLNNNKIIDFIIFFTTILLAQITRSDYIVFAIAMVLFIILKLIKNKKKSNILCILAVCISIFVQLTLPTFLMEKLSGKKYGEGISFYSGLVMAMQEGERAPGWYNGYHLDLYYAADCNIEKQTEIAKKDLEKRINYFNNNKDKAIEFYTKKTASIWNNPTFQCFWNLDDKVKGYPESNYPSWLLWLVSKQGSYQVSKILNVVMMLIYFGATLFGISLFNKEKKASDLFFVIYFIGVFILQLIVEAKAQHTFVPFITLIPLSILGYKRFITKINKIEINPLKIVSVWVVILLLILFSINTFSYLNVDNDEYYNYIHYTEDINK